MKQHTTPTIIRKGAAEKPTKVNLNDGDYNEKWIQDVCFDYPESMPFEEIEPVFNGMIPVCKELSTKSGYVDLIYINDAGFITIGECKLWRNPEARRKVIGQVLDYAKDLSNWNYQEFERACLKVADVKARSLVELMQEYYPDLDEVAFIDNLQRNLQKGRFLLAVIGDGIRENMEELTSFIQDKGTLNFSLSLIEIPVYKTSSHELLITPRVLLKTKEIERYVYSLAPQATLDSTPEIRPEPQSVSISEQVFYERLEVSAGKELVNQTKAFIQELGEEFNITTTLGRGKHPTISLKAADASFNFGSIWEDGEVVFYGVAQNAESVGDMGIGMNYLEGLAKMLNTTVDKSYSKWRWCVKKDGKFINIKAYLAHKEQWKALIREVLDQFRALED